MHNSEGSKWAKWDLQIHTPCSIVQNYGGDNEEVWEKFITDLENLPADFKVLGINDYIFLDGYRKVQQAKKTGRLSNIDLILPVIELRLDKFGGTESQLTRVNFHVIFSDSIDADVIQHQFINALSSSYTLNPVYANLSKSWKALPTRESLSDLGEQIIATVPSKRKKDFGSPLIEGFNNLNFNLDKIFEALRSHYFKGYYLTAVGKTEWWNIKWNDQSIAEKKNIINNSNFVFVSSKTVEDCRKAWQHLSESDVNNRLLDCSDAHNYSDSLEKDRIGKCFTWIKADPCFDGLWQAFHEPDGRIYLGELPPKLALIDANKTKYITNVAIHKKPESSLNEIWFSGTRIDLNLDLVAIIGHKGSGKSALTDIIGLLGNTQNAGNFSFLSPRRFKSANTNKAEHFEGLLFWASEDVDQKDLHSSTDPNLPEKVKYIPQGQFEDICNEIALGEETKFDIELKKVIFSHVDPADLIGTSTLDELISYRTDETLESIKIFESELRRLNEQIVRLEEQCTSQYKERINGALRRKLKELRSHEKSKPAEVPQPEDLKGQLKTVTDALKGRKDLLAELQKKIKEINDRKLVESKEVAAADKILRLIRNFQQQYKIFENELSDQLHSLEIPFSEVVGLHLNLTPILNRREKSESARQKSDALLDPKEPTSVVSETNNLLVQLKELQSELDEPNKRYAEYQSALQLWETQRATIVGSEIEIDSVYYFKHLREEAQQAPEQLQTLRLERLEITKRIYASIQDLADVYRSLYAPVQEFIDTHPIANDQFRLAFDVSIVNNQFDQRLFNWIGHNVVGSFYGQAGGEKFVQDILDRHDFNMLDQVIAFLDDIIDHLTHDKRVPDSPEVLITGQLRKGQTVESLYDYIFSLSYLRPRYVLKLGDKELSLLSPGERGALLLIFYLLIDKDNMPLVIDQPDENLDNQTVYELLVACIKEAKQRRQIIIVTHNPNLAVVCDAEQIICCSIDKSNGNRIQYLTGAIENPAINQRVLDILEGTAPAFKNRRSKYQTIR